MSFRADPSTLSQRVADLEHRMRAAEQAGCCPPDPGWVLREVDGSLHYLYVPTGSVGPVLGTK